MTSDPSCLFCNIIARKHPSHIIYEDDIATVFEDTNPQAPIHVLIVPKKHIRDIHSITRADREIIGHLFFVAKTISLQKQISSSGYRLIINNGPGAGQSIFHIHLHLMSGRPFSWPPG